MTTLDEAVTLAAADNGLAVVSTLRGDATIQASLVNVGKLAHPATGAPALGFVTYGRVKLANLRARPQLAVTFRQGWQWATVEGRAVLAGPDDPQPWLADADAFAVAAARRVHRRRWHPRQLGRVRPGDGRAAPHRGACRTHPRLQQRLALRLLRWPNRPCRSPTTTASAP